MRRTLGTAVFAGMLGVTLFGIFLTPVFYYVIQWFKDARAVAEEPVLAPAAPAPPEWRLDSQATGVTAGVPRVRPRLRSAWSKALNGCDGISGSVRSPEPDKTN
jgi:hypothetical protein